MENSAVRPIVGSVSLNERDVGRAAAEFLAASTERRKRGRVPTVNGSSLDPPRKKLESGGPTAIDVSVARKSAMALMRESPSYKRLVEVEERLDLAIMRKQQDMKEALKSQFHTESRVFRLYLFNTYRSQPDGPGVTEDDIPSWSLRIQGQLLRKGEEPASSVQNLENVSIQNPEQNRTGDGGNAMSAIPPTSSTVASGHVSTNMSAPGSGAVGMSSGATSQHGASHGESQSILVGPPPKCSDIFKRIVIELDKELYPENNLIEWKRNDKEPSSDGFEISRAGSTEFTAKIFLYVDQKPERYRLSYALSRLLAVRTDTRSGIFSAVWQYIRKMRLQCVDDRTAVRLDDGLKTLLGPANAAVEVLKLQQLFSVVKSHMGPPEPLMIEYQVRLSGDVVDNQDCYDIQVDVQDTTLEESARRAGLFGLNFPHSANFKVLNDKHLEALEKIAQHKKRREYFEGFCTNPVQFINHLILSQTRDLKVLGGSTGRNPEEERRASFYQQQWVHEAVPRYLLRKAIADTAEDTLESGLK